MTYIGQKNRNLKLFRAFFLLGAVLFVAIMSEVYVYSQTVSLKHDIISLSRDLESMRLENAALKNEFYSITDRSNLAKLARERGLIEDNNPKWVFASQY